MVVFPNCKINLGLHIREKRADGYHNLETIFYPIGKKDILEVIPSLSGVTTFSQDGLKIEGNPEDNLVLKAYCLLKQHFPQIPEMDIFLYKTIPTGAGLGGGSADGTFMLKLLNEKFQLNIGDETLCEYALQLGSDCPFFVKNTPAFGSGRGEILTPISLNLNGLYICVVNPGIHVTTGWAFGQLNLKNEPSHFEKIAETPVQQWKEVLYNDFEPIVFEKYPLVKELKEALYKSGALYASMSGTGSSCFGIFSSPPDLEILPKEYFKENYPL